MIILLFQEDSITFEWFLNKDYSFVLDKYEQWFTHNIKPLLQFFENK